MMIGAVRQTLRASRGNSIGRGYHKLSFQLLNNNNNNETIVPTQQTRLVFSSHESVEQVSKVAKKPYYFRSFSAEAVKDVPCGDAPKVKLYVGGKQIESQATEHIDVVNPATQAVVSRIPLTTDEEFEDAVAVAKEAYKTWRNTPVTTRQRVMLKLQELIRRDMDKLAMSVTTEQGKTLGDSRGDVFRGLEVIIIIISQLLCLTMFESPLVSKLCVALLWAISTPQTNFGNCIVRLAIASHENCHIKFQKWS
jgi:hypothetical protein